MKRDRVWGFNIGHWEFLVYRHLTGAKGVRLIRYPDSWGKENT